MRHRFVNWCVLVLLVFLLPASLVAAEDPFLISMLGLPAGSDPITGVAYANGYVYAASQPLGVIYQVNMTSHDIVTFQLSSIQVNGGLYQRLYNGLTVDGNGNLWATRADTTEYSVGGLSRIDLPSGTETFVINATLDANPTGWAAVTSCNGFVYTAEYHWLYQVDEDTNNVAAIDLQIPGSIFVGMTCDSSGKVWFTDYANGILYSFDPSTSTVASVAGFHHPEGVTSYNSTVYVAEHVRDSDMSDCQCSPAIVAYDTGTGQLTRTTVTGTPHSVEIVMDSTGTFLAWSSSGEDAALTVGVGILNGPFYPISEAGVYYLSTDINSNIYFGYLGSTGVGNLHGWTAPPSASLQSSAKSSKIGVYQNLKTLSESVTNKNDKHKLDEAIQHLAKSLDSKLWRDETHLDTKKGQQVFNEEKQVVQKLTELINSKESTFYHSTTLQGYVTTLVNADKTLASTAIQDATAANGKTDKLDEANKEFAKAGELVSQGNFADAISHYGNAWQKTQEAMKK
jgi:streptogramin lyase